MEQNNSIVIQLNIQDKFNRELPADLNQNNSRRQILNACFSYVQPTKPQNPSVIHVSDEVADLLGFSQNNITSTAFQNIFSGAEILENSEPQLGRAVG